jgi:DNA-directed RNA polymerase specialized sigma24 family protein
VSKSGQTDPTYLEQVAYHQVAHYWNKFRLERSKLRYFEETGKGEILVGREEVGDFVSNFASNDGDIDARIDARALLATLPKRMIEIGEKRLNGEKLNSADSCYWIKHRKKLGMPKRLDRLSDSEKASIERLHKDGKSVCRIACIMGRSERSVMLHLSRAGLREIGEMPASLRKNKKNLIEINS